jgi:hypothetical protein
MDPKQATRTNFFVFFFAILVFLDQNNMMHEFIKGRLPWWHRHNGKSAFLRDGMNSIFATCS